MSLKKVIICLAAAVLSQIAMAWGADGHQIIAMLAEAQLSPAAKKEVDRLLSLEPGQTLASISTWADEHRNPSTATWHYVNFPRGNCSYEPERDCPDGKCIVGAIERQIQVLRIADNDEKRLLALKYVVHLIGDIHQPLHAGFGDDRGGNNYQLQIFMRGSNLHAVWDTGLIKAQQQENELLVKSLLMRPLQVNSGNFSASKTAEDSCRIVSRLDFYPVRSVTPEYIDTFTPVMTYQLALAGSRLAEVLNTIWK
jgi:hypothetical protein